MSRSNNFPQAGIDDLEPDYVSEVVSSLWELNNMGKPNTDEEVQSRIDEYFKFCQRTGNRPGIESLCLALHISRTTLFNWNAGINCSKERQEIIVRAKGFISAFLEQAVTRGKISPPSGIFLLKNWCNYKDTVSFENIEESNDNTRPVMSIQEIHQARLERKAMPQIEFDEEGNIIKQESEDF